MRDRCSQSSVVTTPSPAEGGGVSSFARRLLDVGCGTGSTLRAFHEISSCWSLVGFDINERCKTAVESIPGVESFYTGTTEEIPGQFEVLTLIHSLEHIAEPIKFLAELRHKLATGGMLYPEYRIVGGTHSCFWSPTMPPNSTSDSTHVVIAAGYDVVVAADDWIAKELTVVARRSAGESPPASGEIPRTTWLQSSVASNGSQRSENRSGP